MRVKTKKNTHDHKKSKEHKDQILPEIYSSVNNSSPRILKPEITKPKITLLPTNTVHDKLKQNTINRK